jgi:hypothetical protein
VSWSRVRRTAAEVELTVLIERMVTFGVMPSAGRDAARESASAASGEAWKASALTPCNVIDVEKETIVATA